MNNNLNILPRPLILMRQINSYPWYSVLRNNISTEPNLTLPSNLPYNILYELAETLSIYLGNNRNDRIITYAQLVQLNNDRINNQAPTPVPVTVLTLEPVTVPTPEQQGGGKKVSNKPKKSSKKSSKKTSKKTSKKSSKKTLISNGGSKKKK
jgi:hypothetical protein